MIILYYKFTPVPNSVAVMKWQIELCASLGLNGRIIISPHGINGTLGGDEEALQCYIEIMEQSVEKPVGESLLYPDRTYQLADFTGIEYKWSEGGYTDFPRLSVKVRKELVTLDPDVEFDPMNKSVGLRPQEWHDFIANNPDVTILDARNDYESKVGRFKGAITPQIGAFKELKPQLDGLDKKKPLLTYCTGDIRCEYLSAYMKENGFDEVYHLDGGIVKYGEEFKDDGYWEGECYVFDKRQTLAFSDKSKKIGECEFCQEPTNKQRNCANKFCNVRQLVCADCENSKKHCKSCSLQNVK